jgi:hypothetical protein
MDNISNLQNEEMWSQYLALTGQTTMSNCPMPINLTHQILTFIRYGCNKRHSLLQYERNEVWRIGYPKKRRRMYFLINNLQLRADSNQIGDPDKPLNIIFSLS